MNIQFVILLLILILFVLVFIEKLIFKQHKVSNVLNVLYKHFNERKEKLVEFRISETKARQRIREFEVKTIRQEYYLVSINGLKIKSAESIDGFSLEEDNCLLHGKIHPINLDRYELFIREANEADRR
ncbi:hypothetical protein [Paenibacillus agilis]|uniref:Uncharacterized protein n=1 Tax=Paenibacillus agilis TaxID=3020863 RepID=A0A559ID62_9BACL|nr:hypothetical protein [Paenibacillus agilis]TVX85602.1 hypothetical protein FPZ44_24930 [Paenibacillus agilis]